VECTFNIAPQKLVNLYPPQKNHPKPTKNWHSGDRVPHWMANNFAMKLHIDNRRLSALWGTLLCQPPKAHELGPQNERL